MRSWNIQTLYKKTRYFLRDRSGVIAIMYALTLSLTVSVAGAAIDFANYTTARSETGNALDSAVLGAGRALQLGESDEQAITVANQYYEQNKSNRLTVDNVTITVENNRTEVVATSDAKLKTSFLGLVGIPELEFTAQARALLSAGANSGSHVEISLMLDTTGSMSWSSSSGGRKMSHLKLAAKDLIDIVVWDDQSQFSSRVALAPFAEYVNVHTTYFNAVTNGSQSNNSRTCVKERGGSNRYTDEAPGGSNGYFERYTRSRSCRPSTAYIMPLSSDKTQLKSAIDALPTSGGTAGHLGTGWSWYLLSPKWNSIWPAASQPNDYSMLSQLNDDGKPLLRKIAVLMTDGEYNVKHSGSSSTTQARSVCTNMKASGIEIYAVGFEISQGGQADTTMAQCASSPDHYYNASDGDALRSAFRDIALKISTLRISE
ncbi:MAG: VWA domain-containing protein [Hyphomicrobiaceae bacterium]